MSWAETRAFLSTQTSRVPACRRDAHSACDTQRVRRLTRRVFTHSVFFIVLTLRVETFFFTVRCDDCLTTTRCDVFVGAFSLLRGVR